MSGLRFPPAMAATGLLTLLLALAASWRTVPWISYASVLDAGPSPGASIAVLTLTIAVSLATLGWGVRRMRIGGDEQALHFPQILVLVGILGLGVVGSLSIWNVYFISVVEWAEGFRLEPSGQRDYRAEVVARSLLSLIRGSDVPVQSTSYSGPLVVQLVAAALPLAVLFEGLRRMLLERRDAAPPVERLGPARLLVVLALFALMVACAAAPMPLYALTNTWGFLTSTVVGELVMLAAGFAFPVATLIVVPAAHRRGGLRASTWFPVAIALLVVAIAAVAVAERGAPVMTIGIPLAALLFAGFAVGRSADAPLSAGQVLGCVALIGLIVVGGATRGTAGTIEVARLYELGHTWLFAVMAITYAINLGVLAAAVWRLRVESRREPVPEPDSA